MSAFAGFEPANTTPVPDILFDELLTELGGGELKVLLYIIRRTLGFKKSTDAISLSQFENGIVTREGKVLDKGCGLSRETICIALQKLEDKGYIKREKRFSKYHDKDITVYSIRFKGDKKTNGEVVGKSDHRSREIRPPVVGKSDPQETVQETVLQQTERQERARSQNHKSQDSHTQNVSSLSLSQKSSSEREENVWVSHPEHTFLRFDDLLAPTLMVCTLTPKFPSREWCESEDDRREGIASEIEYYLLSKGVKITVRIDYEKERWPNPGVNEPPPVQTVDQSVMPVREKREVLPTTLLDKLTDEQADFWTRWRAKSRCGDTALNETAYQHVVELAGKVRTTQDLETLYDLAFERLREWAKSQGKEATPPRLGNLVKCLPEWGQVQEKKSLDREQERKQVEHLPGTGRIRNFTEARLRGELQPVFYPEPKPQQKKSSSMSNLAASMPSWLLERRKQSRTTT